MMTESTRKIYTGLLPLILILATVSCGDSTETKATLDSLRTEVVELRVENRNLDSLRLELERTRKEIARVKTKLGEYGGLVKQILQANYETLRTTESLLAGRIHTIEAGSEFSYRSTVLETDSSRVAELEQELAKLDAKLTEAKRETAKYSGGLLRAVTLMKAETIDANITLVRFEQLISKYGLHIPRNEDAADSTDD